MKTQAQLFKDYSWSQPTETPVCIVSLKELLIRKMAQSENQVCPAYVTPPYTHRVEPAHQNVILINPSLLFASRLCGARRQVLLG